MGYAPFFGKLLLACTAATAAFGQAVVATTIDSAGDVGGDSSMRLGFTGNPVIAYYDATRGDLKLATCTALCDRSNATWVVTTVDSAGDVGRQPSLSFSSNGNPAIAYIDGGSGALKLATCSAGCTSASPTWVIATVASGPAASPSLSAGANPTIAYRDRAGNDLMVATCTAACATAAPTWSFSMVAGPGDTGRHPSLLNIDGRPFIAYYDVSNGHLRMATCKSGCGTSAAAWAVSIVDSVGFGPETRVSLNVNSGFPVMTYFDAATGDLRLAACVSGCAGDTPSFRHTTVDTVGEAGQWSSLVMNGGNATIFYSGAIRSCNPAGSSACHESADLRIAMCGSIWDWASPPCTIRTIDSSGLVGWAPSAVRAGDSAFVSYYDIANGDLKAAYVDVDSLAFSTSGTNYTSLWWDPLESGWGINFTHQGGIVFATLFTYDAAGEPMWLVMSNGNERSRNVFSGTLYRTTGPAFDANPFTPIGSGNLTPVGTMTVGFADAFASLTYDVNGVVVNKTIRRQVFGARAASCRPATGSRTALTNYQDLWWNPAESGWGINLTHQGDTIFATLFTYDAGGRGLWLVMSSGVRQADGSYLGELYRARGPAFNASPFDPIASSNLTRVGTMQLRFTDGTRGTLMYSVNGVSVTKAITRQVFADPPPVCG